MTGIGVVFNARAGRNRRDPEAATRLARRLGDHGVVAAPRSIDELHRVAESFRDQGIDVLGIAGGDGTNHVTLTGFRAVYGATALPTLALLRGGTMNTVADACGVPRERTDGLLDRLVRRYLEAPIIAVPCSTLDVGGRVGFLFGTGVICGYLAEYYATGEPSPWTAARTLGRAIGSTLVRGPMIQRMLRPCRAEVLLGDRAWPARDYLSVAAGTIADIGLGFRPFHRHDEREDAFHLLGIHTGPLGFVLDLPRIHRAEGMRAGKCEEALVARATVRARGGLQYMIDGDLFECAAGEIEVKLGPRVRIATLGGQRN